MEKPGEMHPGLYFYTCTLLSSLLGIKSILDFKTVVTQERIDSIPEDALMNLVQVCSLEQTNYSYKYNLQSEKWTSKLDLFNDIFKTVLDMNLIKIEGGYRLFYSDGADHIEDSLEVPLPYKCDKIGLWVAQTMIKEQLLLEEKKEAEPNENKY